MVVIAGRELAYRAPTHYFIVACSVRIVGAPVARRVSLPSDVNPRNVDASNRSS
jgi:hypothetical protein